MNKSNWNCVFRMIMRAIITLTFLALFVYLVVDIANNPNGIFASNTEVVLALATGGSTLWFFKYWFD